MPDQSLIDMPVLIPVDFYANLEKEASQLMISVEELVSELLVLSHQNQLRAPAAEGTESPD